MLQIIKLIILNSMFIYLLNIFFSHNFINFILLTSSIFKKSNLNNACCNTFVWSSDLDLNGKNIDSIGHKCHFLDRNNFFCNPARFEKFQ